MTAPVAFPLNDVEQAACDWWFALHVPDHACTTSVLCMTHAHGAPLDPALGRPCRNSGIQCGRIH